MTDDELPDDIAGFLRDHVATVADLELLLLLRRGGWWTPERAAGELRTALEPVRAALGTFAGIGLVEPRDDAFRFRDEDAALTALVDRVEACWRLRPVRVIAAIYQRGTSPSLRAFSDAFRLRGKKP